MYSVNTIGDDECYIDVDSNILRVNNIIPNHDRLEITDKIFCPSKKSAQAHIATIQLERLRDCWRQGDIPDWEDTKTVKYIIRKCGDRHSVVIGYNMNGFLSFTDYDTACNFLKTFKDLITQVGDLI